VVGGEGGGGPGVRFPKAVQGKVVVGRSKVARVPTVPVS